MAYSVFTGPKNAEWPTFINDAKVSAETTTAIIDTIPNDPLNPASYIIHFEANPLKGGIPLIPAAPNKNIAKVNGILFPNPEIDSKSVVPVVYKIAPAVKNNNPLNIAWLIIW